MRGDSDHWTVRSHGTNCLHAPIQWACVKCEPVGMCEVYIDGMRYKEAIYICMRNRETLDMMQSSKWNAYRYDIDMRCVSTSGIERH